MNPSIKRLHAVLVLAAVLALPLLQVSTAYPAELTASEKALTFLTDVVGFDMTKYNATLTHNHVEYNPDYYGGLAQERVDYILDSDESTIDVGCLFINKTLVFCNLYMLKGSPLYAQPPTNVLDAAKSILDRYQNYVGDAYLQVMRNMLDTVTEIKPMTKSVGNVKLIVSSGENFARFEWIYTSNGLDFTRKRRSVHFEHGYLIDFCDLWSLYKIGGDSVNVSEEEAISIARNATKDMPKLYGRVGNETIVLQPKVADSPVEAKLMVGIKEPLTLYPLWHVQLYFDKLYGNYYGVAVDIWADTGEICGIYGTGIMGYIPLSENQQQTQAPAQTPSEEPPPTQTSPKEENPTPNPPEQTPPPKETQTNNQTNQNPTPFIIAAAPTILIAIIIATTLYKRKRKH